MANFRPWLFPAQSDRPASGCHAASSTRLSVIRRGYEGNGLVDDFFADLADLERDTRKVSFLNLRNADHPIIFAKFRYGPMYHYYLALIDRLGLAVVLIGLA
ncbi:hypothetical protein [Tateyamaria sp.]|uniref:hypothetical protein n=1 Tax=Tateyamaria sp. TaxID=1929288 RepID=UPI00329C31AC